jgi:hypothetical protein
MKRASIVGAVAGYVFALVLLLLAIGIGVISARTDPSTQTPATGQVQKSATSTIGS